MFEGAMGRNAAEQRKLGSGVTASVLFHVGLLAGAFWLSARAVDPEPVVPKLPIIHLNTSRASPRPAAAAAAKRAPVHHAAQPKLAPAIIRPLAPEPKIEPPPVEATAPESSSPGDLDTPLTGEQIDAPPCDGPDCGGGPPCQGEGCGGTEVVPWTTEMTRPVQISGEDPQYTREALEARVQGLMIAKCVITLRGALENCRVVKGLPHMEQEVLRALSTRRYQPVTFAGQAVAVDYVFYVHLRLP